MGCVSSKLCREERQRDILCDVSGECPASRHVVSLTSSTYGALNKFEGSSIQKKQVENQMKKKEAEKQQQQQLNKKSDVEKSSSSAEPVLRSNVKLSVSPPRDTNICEEDIETEIINAWELMGDLEEQSPNSTEVKKLNKSVIGGNRSPFKRLNQFVSPKTTTVNKLTVGKENRSASVGGNKAAGFFTPDTVAATRSTGRIKKSASVDSPSSVSNSNRRKSLSPLFDPELVEAYEKELSEEGEHIKKVISESPLSNQKKPTSSKYLESFEEKCPPGGENAVVFYTTSLRGIRKTFEECNVVRSILESYSIRMYERDVSMDSGFKEELRKLMGKEGVIKVPMVFVKGRVIGGAEEVAKMEEEGKLGSLLNEIERTELGAVCKGCGGLRFVMCVDCNGSRKVLEQAAIAVDGKNNMVRCCKCNENGLIRCSICC